MIFTALPFLYRFLSIHPSIFFRLLEAWSLGQKSLVGYIPDLILTNNTLQPLLGDPSVSRDISSVQRLLVLPRGLCPLRSAQSTSKGGIPGDQMTEPLHQVHMIYLFIFLILAFNRCLQIEGKLLHNILWLSTSLLAVNACSTIKLKKYIPHSSLRNVPFLLENISTLEINYFQRLPEKMTESVLRYMAWHALLPVFSDLLDYVSNLCLVHL